MEEFSPDEERLNAYTHFFALALGMVLVPILISIAVNSTNISATETASIVIYGLGFLMVFTFSALYHRISHPKRKRLMEKLDHFGINFMIAGTYTPFVMIYAPVQDKLWLLIMIWGLATAGATFNALFPDRYRIVSMLFYVAMGLTIFFSPDEFQVAIPAFQINWLIAGAAVYIAGLIFYIRPLFKHHHAVWHLFVLGGAICHFIAIVRIPS